MDYNRLPIFYYCSYNFSVRVTLTDGGRGDFVMWVCDYSKVVERINKSCFFQEFDYDDLIYLGIYGYDFIEYMKWYEGLRKSLEGHKEYKDEIKRYNEEYENNRRLAKADSRQCCKQGILGF